MSKPCTILVIDDDPDLRETLVDVLSDLGFDVASAEHGAAALQLVEQRNLRPHVILLDIMMPVMDGPMFAAERTKDPRLATVPIIALTAHRDREWAAQQVGAVVCLSKPLKLEKLVAAIQSASGSRRRHAGESGPPGHGT